MTETTYRLPAEWEPQAGVLIAWPHAGTDWADRLAQVETTYVALVAALSRFEPALVCVANADVCARAEALLGPTLLAGGRVRFVEIDYDDTWLRDSGPITLSAGDRDRYRLCDFRFTGWGGKFGASRDDKLVEGLTERGLFRAADHRRIDFALEGGGIESDGAGTLLTTWRCLHQRHPTLGKVDMEQVLRGELKAHRVLWLDFGYLEGDDTDAHIDTLARFAPNDAIVHQSCDDPSDLHYPELMRMADELAALTTPDGGSYTLHPLPWARPIHDGDRRLAASYANYLIVNGGVLVPAYDDPADAEAARIIAAAHPGRSVVQIPCRPLIWQNGSLHCITMQLPQGVLA